MRNLELEESGFPSPARRSHSRDRYRDNNVSRKERPVELPAGSLPRNTGSLPRTRGLDPPTIYHNHNRGKDELEKTVKKLRKIYKYGIAGIVIGVLNFILIVTLYSIHFSSSEEPAVEKETAIAPTTPFLITTTLEPTISPLGKLTNHMLQ